MDILIAEDSLTSRKLLKSILVKKNFNVVEAVDGKDAWEKLQKPKAPKLALIDWMMPNINGIELIQMIREEEKKSKLYTYIIMITSNTEKEDIQTGFEAGADDYITKPIDPNTLEIRLNIGRRIIGQQNGLYRVQKELENQLNKQKENILKAQEIQQILNTKELPQIGSVNIRALYNPSQEMGGDFFNIIKTPSCKLATIMVDCTGHGLEASMYATLLKSVCDRHLSLLDKPNYLANFIQMVNIDVADYINTDQYPVMFVSIYDPETKKVYYGSANGEHPYLIRGGKVVKFEKAFGMHLGYNTESEYEVKSFVTKPDDIVFLYSDAIVEIDNAPWDRVDDTRLKEHLSEMGRGLSIDNKILLKAIKDISGSTTLKDDLSLVYFQIKAPYHYEQEIVSKDELEEIKEDIRKKLVEYDYMDDEVQEILIVTNELVYNAIEHGNSNDPNKKVFVGFEISCSKITMTIEDEGEGFDESLIPDPTNLNRLEELIENEEHTQYTHGRGVWMVKKFMDNVIFSKGGKMAVATKKKRPATTYNNYTIGD